MSGLLIFGAQLEIPPLVMNPVTLLPEPNGDWDCTRVSGDFYTSQYKRCPMDSNYDTLLWSIVTTFQLLTRENWGEILVGATLSFGTWAVIIYFCTIVAFGGYVILNLFIAVIIDAFLESQERVAKKILERALSHTEFANDDATTELSEDADTPIEFDKWAEAKLLHLNLIENRHTRVTNLECLNHNSLGFVKPTWKSRIFMTCLVTSSVFEWFVIGACGMHSRSTQIRGHFAGLCAVGH